MKRLLAAWLLIILLPGLGFATALDRARLFDWYYPSEPAYQELLKVANSQGRGGWLVREMQAGHSIPQASARELAYDFIQSPATSAQDKQDLQALFKPESVAAIKASANDTSGVGELEKRFVQLNEQMNELEATIKKNNYNKQSYPSAGANLSFAYDSNGASGLLAGQNAGSFYGGISVNFNGQADAGSWSFGVGEGIDNNGGNFLTSSVYQHGSMTTGASPNFQMGYSDATLSVNLGGSSQPYRTALALASPAAPGAPNNFYINYTGSSNPNYVTTELATGLPAGPAWIPQIFSISKSGSARYWPFQSANIYFGPDGYGYTASWGSHRIFWGGDLSMDMGNLWGLVDHQLLSAAYNGTEGDQDLAQSFSGGLGDQSYSHRDWAVETDTLTSWGGRLFMDYGQASVLDTNGSYVFSATNNNISGIVGYPGGKITGFQRKYSDDGFVVVYNQPVSLFNFGLEYSKIGPLFEPTHGAVSPSSLLGTDNFFKGPNAQWNSQYTSTPWVTTPPPAGHMENGKVIVDSLQDIAWATNASVATGLMSNTQKIVLQTQFSWSWISLGVFDGIASQIEPSGPWMQTVPTFESGNGGNLLVSRFTPAWLPGAPLPFTAAPSPPATANYYQWAYDHWTDGRAVYDSKGNSIPVHWNQLIDTGGSAEYMVFFSKNGVGDPRFDDFNQKFINYIAFTLKLDIQSLLGRTLPFDVQLYGQSTDVAPAPGLAHFGDPGKPGDPGMIYWNQTNESLFVRYGWTQTLTLIGLLRSEDWHSNHSFLPIYITMFEYGAGFDVDANKILTGLGFNFRSRIVRLEDHNIGGRTMSVWDTSIGSSIGF